MSTLNYHLNTLIFADSDTITSNPKLRQADVTIDYTQIQVINPKNDALSLAPAEVQTIFNGTRTLGVDGTTTMALTLNSVKPGVYRLSVTGGTAAGFRASRVTAVGGSTITVAINNNATATFSLPNAGGAPDFSACAVGDVLFLPDVTTGDSASPFNNMNVGFWQILAIGAVGGHANKMLSCARLPGQVFQGVAEVVAVVSDSQFVVFSNTPVQAGDTLVLSAGFSVVTQNSYVVQAVTDTWLEFASGLSLPLESGILPTAAGITIYSQAKDYVRIEVDQPAVIRVNGDTSNYQRLQPRTPADLNGRAWYEKWGPVWSLVVVNLSVSQMGGQFISATEAD